MKIFLLCVGILYLFLSLWCSFDPVGTSNAVGFQLVPGSGQSEFLTIYGGLEFGMALLFFAPLIIPKFLPFSLLSCFLLHVSLVIFRTIGFFVFENLTGTTYRLAVGEWFILLLSIFFLLQAKKRGDFSEAAPG